MRQSRRELPFEKKSTAFGFKKAAIVPAAGELPKLHCFAGHNPKAKRQAVQRARQ
jgi:hypothetical protein